MSAYISDSDRYDMNLQRVILPKAGRDEGEVTFTALLLPSDMPESALKVLGIADINGVHRVKDRFRNDLDVKGKEHFLIQNDEVIETLWSLSDRNIRSIEQSSNIYKNRKTQLRLYDLYLFTSPVAHKHFPSALNVTHEDLRELDERVMYEICDEFFLSKGLAVEIGRHQNKENIIHYHVQTTNRIFKYKHEQQTFKFNHFTFVAWLSKAKLEPLRTKVISNKSKVLEWELKLRVDPSDYNRIRLENWTRKVTELEQEHNDIQDIMAGIIKTGTTYAKYQDIYVKNQQKRIKTSIENNSIFSSHKGSYEMFLDRYDTLDRIKERYAQVLNQHLIEAKLIQPGTQLYQFSKSLRDFITVQEARNCNITDDKRVEINKKLNEVFKIDQDFFTYEMGQKGKKKKIDRKKKVRKRLIIHGLKTIIKQHLHVNKPSLLKSEKTLNQWVKLWRNQLDIIKDKYSKLIETLLQHHIYNFDWRKAVRSNLVELTNIAEDKDEIQQETTRSELNKSMKQIADIEKEVVDIQVGYHYNENELNYETLVDEIDEDDASPVIDFNPLFTSTGQKFTWEMFYELLQVFDEEIKSYEINFDDKLQQVVFEFNHYDFDMSYRQLCQLMKMALEHQMTFERMLRLLIEDLDREEFENFDQQDMER